MAIILLFRRIRFEANYVIVVEVRPTEQMQTRSNIILSVRLSGGGDHIYLNIGSTGPCWSEIADFEPIFPCSASAVTPSKKSSINTNMKSTTISLRW